jgi:hypothetical protein
MLYVTTVIKAGVSAIENISKPQFNLLEPKF